MKQLSTRIEDEVYEKFRFICRKRYFRSLSKQLSRLIVQFIAQYETENGDITLGLR